MSAVSASPGGFAATIGVHHLWGFTPALDLLSLTEKHTKAADDSKEPIVILLVQTGDIRHVIKTLARRFRHSARPLEFLVFESVPEILARDVLLLSLALDWELPLRRRCNTFLEIFGNCRVQERTARYIAKRRIELINLVCNAEGPLANIVDVSRLRYKERDELEYVFKTWASNAEFDVETLRDYRVRHLCQERYDFRKNLIDWDYQTHIRPQCGNVHSVIYRDWRMTGIAFEFGDERYTAPNRTMATYAEGRERGLTKIRRGFWADIAVGPFFALGESFAVPTTGLKAAQRDETRPDAAGATVPAAGEKNARDLAKVVSRHTGAEQFRHTSVEVAVFNMLSFLWEIETHATYFMRLPHNLYSGLGWELEAERRARQQAAKPVQPPADEGEGAAAAGDAKEPAPTKEPAAAAAGAGEGEEPAVPPRPAAAPAGSEEEQAAQRARAVRRARRIARSVAGFKVTLLTGSLTEHLQRGWMRGRLDCVVLGSRMRSQFGRPGDGAEGDAWPQVLKPRATVVTETARNVIPLTESQRDLFTLRMLAAGGALGLQFRGSDRELLNGEELYVPGSFAEAAGSRAAVALQERRRSLGLEDQGAALRVQAVAGPHAKAVMFGRDTAAWDIKRGDNARPEHLVFDWAAADRESRAAAHERFAAAELLKLEAHWAKPEEKAAAAAAAPAPAGGEQEGKRAEGDEDED